MANHFSVRCFLTITFQLIIACFSNCERTRWLDEINFFVRAVVTFEEQIKSIFNSFSKQLNAVLKEIGLVGVSLGLGLYQCTWVID